MRSKEIMRSNSKTALIVGILFIVGYIGVFLGSAYYAPILDAPDYLSNLYPNRTDVIIGMLIELLNDVAVVGIAVILFPILNKHNVTIAVGYLAIRMIEAILLIVSKINILSLIPLSQDFIAEGSPVASYFQGLADLALAERYWAGKIQVVFFVLGAILLYYILYKTKLVPRFISVWGFIAVVSLITANVIGAPDPTQGFEPAMLLYFPIFLSELILAGWLIFKGFNPDEPLTPLQNRAEKRVIDPAKMTRNI